MQKKRRQKVGQREVEVIEISPCSTEKEERAIKTMKEEEEEKGTPVGAIFCMKKSMNLNHFEEMEDCFILDFDPFESVAAAVDDDDDNDVSVVAEKGQVACRDYPHSRHLCLKFPFDTTPHESYCELCHCYVCDSVAPCNLWTEPGLAHCHAAEHVGDWKSQRYSMKQLAVHK